MSGAHQHTDRNALGSQIERRAAPAAYAIAREVNRLLPMAAREAATAGKVLDPGRHASGRQRAPICQSCGWQHTTQVAGAACVDPAACAKRQEEWT